MDDDWIEVGIYGILMLALIIFAIILIMLTGDRDTLLICE